MCTSASITHRRAFTINELHYRRRYIEGYIECIPSPSSVYGPFDQSVIYHVRAIYAKPHRKYSYRTAEYIFFLFHSRVVFGVFFKSIFKLEFYWIFHKHSNYNRIKAVKSCIIVYLKFFNCKIQTAPLEFALIIQSYIEAINTHTVIVSGCLLKLALSIKSDQFRESQLFRGTCQREKKAGRERPN